MSVSFETSHKIDPDKISEEIFLTLRTSWLKISCRINLLQIVISNYFSYFNKFQKRSSRYKCFSLQKFSKTTKQQLLMAAYDVIRCSSTYLDISRKNNAKKQHENESFHHCICLYKIDHFETVSNSVSRHL